MKPLTRVLTVLAFAGWAGGASALVIDASDMGWYNQDGRHLSFNLNYSAGSWGSDRAFDPPSLWNNFFVFDLSSLNRSALSATLSLNVWNTNNGEYTSTSGTYSLYHVSTAIPDLVASSTSDTDIWDDLASGTVYGSRSMSTSDSFNRVSITLNSAALANITSSAGGLFAIGGTVDNEFRIGGNSQNFLMAPQLTISSVPVSGTLALLSLGIASLGWTRRRKA